MCSAPFHTDEAGRLRALKETQLLDTLPEPEFDELVQLAAELCECPIALISLVDEDRQWFKARQGIELKETVREVAFCGHAILGQTLLMVPDAQCDARFADNPLVTGQPGIRFYAGMPLITPQGHPLGTLCVIDYRARELSQLQQRSLSVLAHQVMRLIELRRVQCAQAEMTIQIERTRRGQNELNALDYETELTLEDRFARALDILLVYTGLDGAGIYEVQGDEALVVAQLEVPPYGERGGEWFGRRIPLAGETVELILKRNEVLAWEDLAADHPARVRATQVFGIHNLLGAPYLIEGRPAGVVNVYGFTPAQKIFSELQREFMQMFATWLGAMLERYRLQARLQELQEIHTLALSSALAGVWVLPDLSGEAVWWSERIYEILGYTPDTFTPTRSSCREMMHPDDQERVQQDARAAMESGQPFRTDMRMRSLAGEYIWCQLFGIITGPAGQKRMTGVMREIGTERRMAQQSLESAALLQRMHMYQARLTNLSYDISLSREQMMTLALEIALEYYGLPSGFITQVHGEVFEILALQDDRLQARRPELKPGLSVSLAGSFTEWMYHHETVLSLDDILAASSPAYADLAERFELRSLIGRVFRVQGQRFGPVVCYGPDQKPVPFTEFEHEFMEYFSRWLGFMIERSSFIEHLQQLNASQNHLLAVVAHDLRSPLASIQSAKWRIDRQLAKGQAADERLLSIIDSSCNHANNLIQELLELAELEQGAQLISFNPVVLQDLLRSALELFERAAQDKDLKLVTELPEEPLLVAANPPKLRRAIENLLSNAVKFTPAAGTVSLSLTKEENDARIRVTDTGIGIPPELLTILFDKFTKAGRPGTAGERTHGLGMHISREIVTMHKGQITVTSEVGQGTSFCLVLPLAATL